jgi:hypothetical protein
MREKHLQQTPLLDFASDPIRRLIEAEGWFQLPAFERIGAAYTFVRDRIAFGYNRDDNIPASAVLADGYGQCNTKGTLLMALLRALGVSCRLHGFTIHKALQRGVVPELVYGLVPDSVLHSWVEIYHDGRWTNLDGFILDRPFLSALQAKFPERAAISAVLASEPIACRRPRLIGLERIRISSERGSMPTLGCSTAQTTSMRNIGKGWGGFGGCSTVTSSATG